jgi:Na+/H+ antiporter NhaB
MAFLAAVPALTTAVTVASAAVGIYGAVQQHQAGQEAKAESKQAAMREASAARQDEIERRRGLMKVLAARSASAGAAGVGTGGSIGALTRQDIKDNRQDLLVSGANSQARQRALRSAGRSAAKTGTANAVSSLLDTAKSTYRAAG